MTSFKSLSLILNIKKLEIQNFSHVDLNSEHNYGAFKISNAFWIKIRLYSYYSDWKFSNLKMHSKTIFDKFERVKMMRIMFFKL